ncbi:Wiskott-Aldrich syndrome like protein [Termitomyces sp. J132]|nr:Wiskott-Aldrich syndrome like protein [Termitomyces sp. J132]
MPSQSMLSSEEKTKVKASVHGSKVLHAARARVYYAYPDPIKWSYAGLQGAIAFVKDGSTGASFFKLVDLDGTRGIIWEHELYSGLEYHADRAFFHSFAGDDCMIGFVFCQETEAKTFWKRVTKRKHDKSPKSSSPSKKKSKSKVGKGGSIDKSLISAPTAGSFVHIGHMGYDAEKGFTSTGVDPSWTALLTNLENSGLSKETVLLLLLRTLRHHQPHIAMRGTGSAPSGTTLPAPQPGRTALLESIQGKGIHSLRKMDPNAGSRGSPPASGGGSGVAEVVAGAAIGAGAVAGGDLTSALISALAQRNKDMGDSDDEDEDDDWDSD